MFDTNVHGTFLLLAQPCCPQMKRQQLGHIVNIASHRRHYRHREHGRLLRH